MEARLLRLTLVVGAAALAFVAGLTVGRAQAPAVGWGPTVIHVGQMVPADFPTPAPNAYARVKMEAKIDTGAVQVQMGATQKPITTTQTKRNTSSKGRGCSGLGISKSRSDPAI